MKTTSLLRNGLMAALLSLACMPISAHHWHTCRHFHPVTTVITRPAVTTHVSNRFSQKERLAMALAYVHSHQSITVKQYAKITGLNKDAAEAELDAFVLDKRNKLAVAASGKSKIYVLAQ